MPLFYNDILCVTATELVPVYFKSVNVLSATLTRDKKKGYGMRRVMSGGCHHDVLVEFDSLSIERQNAIGDIRKKGHILERFYKIDSKIVKDYQDFVFSDGTHLKDDIQERYITNASVLQAVTNLKMAREYEIISKGFRPLKIYQSLCEDCISFNPLLKQKYDIQHTLPEHYLRFKYVHEKFISEGFQSLISLKHKNKNGLKVDERVEELLNNLFADKKEKTKPSFIEVNRRYEAFLTGYTRAINEVTGEEYNPQDFPKLSQQTIRNYLTSWENAAPLELIRSGNRQIFNSKYRLAHSHRATEFASTIISVDDRQPPFWYDTNRNRVWFYMAYDDGSECFTVWVNDTTKEGLIQNFYRQMVRNYYEWGFNLPLELECEASLNSNHTKTFLMPGRMFKDVRIEANNARGKIIERKFKDLRYEYEKEHFGWLARPSARLESNQPGYDQTKKPKDLMRPYNEIVELCLKDIEQWNNRPHSIEKNISRWEYFCTRQNKNTQPINWRGILPYLGYKTETSCKTGQLKLQSQEWLLGDNGEIYLGDKLIKLYKQVEGQQIDVYWLDGNNSKVIKALIYIGNQYICEALPKPQYARGKAEQTEEDLNNYELLCKYVSTIDAYLNRTKKLIDKVLLLGVKPKIISDTFKITGALIVKNEELAVGSKQLAVDGKHLVVGGKQLAVGGKQLAVDGKQLAVGGKQNVIVKEIEQVEELVMPEEEENVYVVDKKNLIDRF